MAAQHHLELKTHPAYRPDIDGLRAIAVLGVVIFHAFPSLLPGGFIGVDVFFVISGFLIGTILLKSLESGQFSFADFYARRIRRIFPALILILVACLAVGSLVLLPDEFGQLGKHTAAGAAFIANFAFWTESGYFDVAGETKPLLHLWSLAIEEQFYLFWPLILWGAWKARANLLLLTVSLAAISFAINLYQIPDSQPSAFFLLPARAWELLAGSTLAWLSLRVTRPVSSPAAANALSFAGLLLVVTPMFLAIPSAAFPGWYAALPVAGSVLLIAATPRTIINRLLLSNRWMVWVGLISYPLYLWHWPLLSLARIVESEVPSAKIRCAAVLISLALAFMTYRCIEKPLRRLARAKSYLWLLLAIMTVVAATGYWSYSRASAQHKSAVQNLERAKKNCDALFPDWLSLTDNPCRMQLPENNTVALVGDSHAGHLYTGLSEYLPSGNGVAVFPASCAAPYINISSAQKNKSARYAREKAYVLINRAYEHILKSDSIKTVVLAHWPGCSFNDTIDRENPEQKDYLAALHEGMERTFAKLIDAKKKIVVVLDNPFLPYNPGRCEPRPFRLTKQDDACSFPRSTHEKSESVSNYKALIEELVAKHPQIRVVDLSEALCDEQTCHIAIDGQMMYLDRGHLNFEGSRLVAPRIAKEILD